MILALILKLGGRISQKEIRKNKNIMDIALI